MKKVTYKELGEYLGKLASEEFGRYYSEDINDWLEDLRRAENNAEYNEKENIYKTNLEISDNGKILNVELHFKEVENNGIVEIDYYI